MMGEDRPPGTDTFHFTFLSGPNSTGGFWSSATPEPPGPRNCGQGGASAPSPAAVNTPTATNAIHPLITLSSVDVITDRRGERCVRAPEPSSSDRPRPRLLHAAFIPRTGPLFDTVPRPPPYRKLRPARRPFPRICLPISAASGNL